MENEIKLMVPLYVDDFKKILDTPFVQPWQVRKLVQELRQMSIDFFNDKIEHSPEQLLQQWKTDAKLDTMPWINLILLTRNLTMEFEIKKNQ